MKLYDLENISKVDELYDLTQLTYSPNSAAAFATYEVQKGEEMRMDLICENIYGDTRYVDLLCSVNDIDNPLNVRVGQILVYPTSDLDTFRYSEENQDEEIKQLANSSKTTRKDKNRKKYLDNNLALPPTTLQNKVNQLNISGENIILGRGLF